MSDIEVPGNPDDSNWRKPYYVNQDQARQFEQFCRQQEEAARRRRNVAIGIGAGAAGAGIFGGIGTAILLAFAAILGLFLLFCFVVMLMFI